MGREREEAGKGSKEGEAREVRWEGGVWEGVGGWSEEGEEGGWSEGGKEEEMCVKDKGDDEE